MALQYWGARPTGRVWPTQLKISGINAPAEPFEVDPTLPGLGSDPKFPTDVVVIPKGRLVAITQSKVAVGKTVITLADGFNNTPFGYAASNIFRNYAGTPQPYPVVAKQELIEVPYVAAINDAYSLAMNPTRRLQRGVKIMPYYGSVTSTNKAYRDVGKIVEWVPKKVFAVKTASASSAVVLPAANLPGIQPRVVYSANAGTVTGAATGYVWSTAENKWIARFNANVDFVLYEFGADADQIAGEVVAVELINDSGIKNELDGWLKWVTDDFEAWEQPPIFKVRPSSTDTFTVTGNSAITSFTLPNKPINPYRSVTVVITGTVIDPDGTTRSVTGYELPLLADEPFVDYCKGKDYAINPLTGEVTLFSSVQATAITVTYSYFAPYVDGIEFGSGQIGLTDGAYSGVAGTPAHLEVPGVNGALRVAIY